ncbi:MAG: ABC transporter substrate-binding protein [Anaerolineales bacterium]|nr:ABC transporter substrate-binding protein [Anaerolineales bacterium]MDW8227942.1 ABC transporter substrate-binding protein [Anaerolineales bacterium]
MKLRNLWPLVFLPFLGLSCGVFPLLFEPTATPTVEPSVPPAEFLFTPTAQEGEKQVLTLCAAGEPTDLFIYGEDSLVKQVLFAAIYDGPIDYVNFQYQPVILEKLPSLADGDAVLETVNVHSGDVVVDASQKLAYLLPGVRVRPAGCRSDDCVITYEGGVLQMERLRVIFRLRPGVFWEDGEPLLAHDSVFSYRIASDPETLYGNHGLVSSSPASLLFTASYIALDDLTVEWTGLPGFLDQNYSLNFFHPLPEHVLSQYSLEELLWSNEALYRPTAWGPYRVEDWQASKQIVLQPNPFYFRREEARPFFDEVILRFVGSGPGTALSEFQNGSCDLVLPDALPLTLTPDLLEWSYAGAARLIPEVLPMFEYLVLNVQPTDPALPSLFADSRTRRAVAACLDRAVLTDMVYAGFVPPLQGFLFPSNPQLSNADFPSLTSDPKVGRMLLEQAGWFDLDGDGIREAAGVLGVPDGTRLQFTLYTTDAPLRDQIGQWLVFQLRECGFDVSVERASVQELLGQRAEAMIAGRRFQAAELAASTSITSLCERGRSDQIPSEVNGWSGLNVSGYVNPSLDLACARLASSFPGTSEYLSAYREMLRIFSEELPLVPLFLHHRFWLAQPDLSFPNFPGWIQQFEMLQRQR